MYSMANEWRRTDNGFSTPLFSMIWRPVLQVLCTVRWIAAELIISALVAVVLPLPPNGLKFSLDSFDPDQLTINFDGANPAGSASSERTTQDLTARVLLRLEEAAKRETDPWILDDLRISWITVLWSSRGVPAWSWHHSSPYVAATYQVLRCHPDQVWPNIVARRKAILRAEYSDFFPASSPKKPCASVREIPFPKNSDQKKRAS